MQSPPTENLDGAWGRTKPFLLLPTEARGHAPLQPGIFVDQNDLDMRTDSRFSTVAMSIALALAGPSLLSRDLSALAMPHVDGSAAVPLMSAEPLMLGAAALPGAAAIRRPRVVVKVPITLEHAAASANYSNTTTTYYSNNTAATSVPMLLAEPPAPDLLLHVYHLYRHHLPIPPMPLESAPAPRPTQPTQPTQPPEPPEPPNEASHLALPEYRGC